MLRKVMTPFFWFFVLLVTSRVQLAANELPWMRNINTSNEGSAQLGPFKEIKVSGLKKIERESVIDRVKFKEGGRVSAAEIRSTLKELYKTGYFDSVKIYEVETPSGLALGIELVERPIVSAVEVNGNDELDLDELTPQIKTKEFSLLDISLVKQDVVRLQKFYQDKGHYLASIDFKVETTTGDDNEPQTKVIFQIKEFDKVKVKHITFVGNHAIPSEELKAVMETREDSLFSFMTDAGTYREQGFQTDVERLKYFYKTKGHLQVNIDIPLVTISEDKRWVFVTLAINEGPVYQVNDISFTGDLLFSDEDFLNEIKLKKGDTYSEETLRQDIIALTEKYQDRGFAFANVLRTLNIVPGETKVDIVFEFEMGRIAHFGNITVKGNTKTRDKVIRRELRFREGELYSGSALRESKENVNRLGFFEPGSVIFNTLAPEGRNDVLDVEIIVKERNTGQITLSAGYSSATKGFITGSVQQNNFMGKGQVLGLSLNHSSRSQSGRIDFTEPYLFDSQWTAGGGVFISEDSRSAAYELAKKGFYTRLGHPIFDYTRLYLTYKFEDTKLSNVKDPTVDESLENGLASTIDTTIEWDKRNNKFEPSSGHFLGLTFEYAGLGGDKYWYKNELDGRYYYTVWGDLVLRTRVHLARMYELSGERQVPRSEKYYLGGSRNMRGHGFEAIGPKRKVIVDGKEIIFNSRGLTSVLGTFELEHPLVREAGIKWVIFLDTGNVYEKTIGENGDYSLKADYGFGFRWFSPLGVLRFEFGYPITKEPGEKASQFHFDIGQLF